MTVNFEELFSLDNYEATATEDDVRKAELISNGFINQYKGPVTVVSATIDFEKPDQNDDRWFQIALTVTNAAGQSKNIYRKVSFITQFYSFAGQKPNLREITNLNKLFRSLGFKELGMTVATARVDKETLLKYCKPDSLKLWEGLTFEATFDFKETDLRAVNDGHAEFPYVVVDGSGQPKVFPSFNVIVETNGVEDVVTETNYICRAATTERIDELLKGSAVKYAKIARNTQLITSKRVDSTENKQILAKFTTPVKVVLKPVAKVVEVPVPDEDDIDFSDDE